MRGDLNGDADIQNESASLISHPEKKYKKHEIILDIILFSFAVWAQFGYSFYSQENALESLNDPLSKYLYPHISENTAASIFKILNYSMRAFSLADATFTTISYINMRHCRNELASGLRIAFEEYKCRKNFAVLFINCFLTWSFFVISSFSPWTGFSRHGYGNLLSNIAGQTMWIGLMISYAMSYAPYTFSTSQKLIEFYQKTPAKKKEIFHPIFFTKKGFLGFLPRAIVSIVNRGLVLHGSAILTLKWVFKTKDPLITYPFSILSVISTVYQTLMSQTIKDYNSTFNPLQKTQQFSKEAFFIDENGDVSTRKKVIFYAFYAALFTLSAIVFLFRALAVPSLYTGEINNPANNYTAKDTILSGFGFLCGGYAAYQYVRFRCARWEDNFATFFQSQNETKNVYGQICNNRNVDMTKISEVVSD
ncbi:MAG: putative membrane spanning protein [uncultured bacterium]|nr:MAG: putative membrane spanning protein [uncultured bacterium]OGT26080.1 MAG: hypothetical protein A3B71_04270 [Gammaproteobacteria bacterium RIFCSPHIGHO2_02_FULL_42_43]OGT29355.1 MAG: hypothetical protein A2624_06115 [Gammaproteobacteria bacterium RIFCSPHIGHO2_01_FULL_42_8]OGT50898.1 MAG: hypothetical protein A3E54_03960 [Gammaproteobacteria bacterium RIFCSPHIGHO2_12_FULL_41_25]OGT62822.1 MAG: hypothetical protein A3I77_00165 [Gammaproteobacteria bacterium RIFCSPLOWO2_02_FULL_42_14]OGT8678